MAKYNVADAARRAKIARSTMYERYINTGKITVEKIEVNGLKRTVIDSAEWERVFGENGVVSADANNQTPVGRTHTDAIPDVYSGEVHLLREQLRKAEEREREQRQDFKEREQRLLDQVDKLTDTIRQIEHKPEAVVADPERPSWIVRVLTKKIF